MERTMPSPGIWFVDHKEYSKSYSKVMKISDIPEKWPLLHYYEYKDQITSALLEYYKEPRSLDEVVRFILDFISKQYVSDRDKRMPDKKINTLEDLIDQLNT